MIRIVVVGFGPVAARLVESLETEAAAGRVHLTVIGAEPDPAYNRVLIADVGVGRTTPEAIRLADPGHLRGLGVDVRLGSPVRRIDRARQRVLLDDGTPVSYDRLVLATGSHPVVPYLAGLNPGRDALLPPGVTTLRDVKDAGSLNTVVRGRGRVVVLGGGILGLEAALAASEEGARVTLVHHGRFPLGRTVDDGGGSVLADTLRHRGITLVSDARAVGLSLADDGRFTGLQLAAGEQRAAAGPVVGHAAAGPLVAGDLLVLSCGVRPRAELAEGAGLSVGSGILVDHSLRTRSDGQIFAIGDCAEIKCASTDCLPCVSDTAPPGLIGPGWRQAEWLAAQFRAESMHSGSAENPAAPVETDGDARAPSFPDQGSAVLMLKARGVDAVMAGDTSADPWTTSGNGTAVALWADPEHGRYAKMVTRDGVLTGLICVGLPRTGAELVLLFERGGELPADRSSLLRLDGPDGAASPTEPDSTVTLCRCAGVPRGQVEDAARAGCSTVSGISTATRAGTGCGGCHDDIRAVIETHFSAAAPQPAVVQPPVPVP